MEKSGTNKRTYKIRENKENKTTKHNQTNKQTDKQTNRQASKQASKQTSLSSFSFSVLLLLLLFGMFYAPLRDVFVVAVFLCFASVLLVCCACFFAVVYLSVLFFIVSRTFTLFAFCFSFACFPVVLLINFI